MLILKFVFFFAVFFSKSTYFFHFTHTNNWYFAYKVIIKMIRWHGFCDLFLFLCVFCLLFLSNCLLHYLTNPMIIIYFVCLSCFFFLLLFLYFFPLLTLTHPPLFDICGCDSHLLNTQITINDVFLFNYCLCPYLLVCIFSLFVSLAVTEIKTTSLGSSFLSLYLYCVCFVWKITIISFHCL